MTTWINGEAAAAIDSHDRGLQYGDGLFETMRAFHGSVRLIDYHLDRLLDGCERLAIAPPARAMLQAEIECAARSIGDGIVKLIVTRGSGGRGYRPAGGLQPTRIVMTFALPPQPIMLGEQGGVRVRIAQTMLARQPRLAGLKHLNRLEQVLAAAETDAERYAESLMRDDEEHIIDGTMMNLFCISGGELLTPELSQAGVSGVMRRFIRELADGLAIPQRETPLSRAQLDAADEVFLCNAVRGIWPVIGIEDRHFATGPVTRQLQAALAERWP